LSGRVLPIGGLKEKILGAVRAGITHIVIPRDNEADLDDLPADVREKLVVTPVDTLAEALAVTIRDTTLRDGRLFFGQRVSGVSELAH
jgi:ATP-dependent Lon protease